MLDYAIRGGLILDGTGKSGYTGTVYMQDGKIALIETGDGTLEANASMDAAGQVICPGFIDIHSHSDEHSLKGIPCQSKLWQGITTEIVGNCGQSFVPRPDGAGQSLDAYAQAMQQAGMLTHFGVLIGHGQLRDLAMGCAMRPPRPEELERMQSLLNDWMEQGAFGLSLGLIYPPGSFCEPDELISLSRVVKAHDGLVSVHLRSEGAQIFEAVEEMLHVARVSGVRLEISHIKLSGRAQWGQAERLVQVLEAARRDGVRVTCDQYPYTASSTDLSVLLPDWAHEGGREKMQKRLGEPALREEMRKVVAQSLARRAQGQEVSIAYTEGGAPEVEGQDLLQIAGQWHIAPDEAALRLLEQCPHVSCVLHTMSVQDMEVFMAQPLISVGTDGLGYSADPAQVAGVPHPRNFGAFPRFLQTVRERRLISLPEAVHKMTGLPAQVLGLTGRGLLAPGMAADVCVLDPERVGAPVDYQHPVKRPEGIHAVWVSGALAYVHGVFTGVNAGRVLRE